MSRLPSDRPLRVAMLSPIAWRTPPRAYGPWELMTSLLTEGLVQRGVEVTLFATGESETMGKLVSVCPRGYAEDPSVDAKVWECLHISEVFERARAGAFDLIHNQFDFLPLSYSRLVDVPLVTTIHGFSSERIVPVYQKYNHGGYYVAISHADRHPKLRYAATIHHGIPMDQFEPRFEPVRESEDYLLFFGRIHPDKGVVEALDLAERSGERLIIAGIIQDQGYYDQNVKNRIDGQRVKYVGPAGPEQRQTLLAGAKALLHLINFDEPFGLSVVEAMACGTPVLARPRGSMPEIIEPGVNGILTQNAEEDLSALQSVVDVDRRGVRRSAEQRFSVTRMVENYLDLYHQILRGG